MESLIDDLKKQYVSDLAKALPLTRAFVFFVSMYALQTPSLENGIWISLMNSKVFDVTKLVFKSATFWNVILCSLVIVVGIKCATWFRGIFANWTKSFFKWQNVIDEWAVKAATIPSTSQEVNQHLKKEIVEKIKVGKKKLVRLHLGAEMTLILALFSVHTLHIYDIFFMIFFVILTFVIELFAAKHFVANLLPYLVSESSFYQTAPKVRDVLTKMSDEF